MSLQTTVVCLRNMVFAHEVDDELKNEIEAECEKYGRVHRVVIAVLPNSEDVKIFVQFQQPTGAFTQREPPHLYSISFCRSG